MNKIKTKFFLLGLAIVPITLFFVSSSQAAAANPKVYFFYGDGCPHCAKEEVFFDDLLKQEADIEVESLEVWNNDNNVDLLLEVGKVLDADIGGVPFTLVGGNYISGFSTAETTGAQIKNFINYCRANECEDIVKAVREGTVAEITTDPNQDMDMGSLPETIDVPFMGQISIKSVSLPLLTVIIAALDGFNPCAMWVLIFLIGFLIGMDNWKRRWLLGVVFLVSSAVVYFIFMAAWLNLLLFLGVVIWVRLAIGALALGGGFVNLKQYWQNPQGTCKVTAPTKRKLVFEKLKTVALEKQLWLALLGIIVLAFAVNLVELICSAGLPAVYTQVLALSNLSPWQYYGYLILYIFIFLIDDILVFVIAMVTLQVTGLSAKYSRYSNLIGGIIMVIIGILLIFKPEWLMFG